MEQIQQGLAVRKVLVEEASASQAVEVFSTCPQSINVAQSAYLQNVIEVARWSEEAGCKGILVYTDNGLVDPWLVAQIIIQNTKTLCPLVAVQPIYMHPYTVAKMVSSLAHLHGRRVYLNMLAGGFKNDLAALNDHTPHDRRYDRMVEYTEIIRQLLSGASVTFSGEFYQVENLKLSPPLSPELFPGIFVSGSSDAGLAAARATGAVAVQYPKPAGECAAPDPSLVAGIRVGIVSRADEAEAWRVAHERFPADRKGQLAHQLALKVSDSVWHKQLSELGKEEVSAQNPYWLWPFQNYKTFCPYLVGSYATVAREVSRYIALGYKTFILDIPPHQEELQHINSVFRQAQQEVQGDFFVTAMGD